MNKDPIISAQILLAMAGGMDLPAAFDSLMGEGAYIKFAGYLYDTLRAK